jgi:two-component system sensor histidine kinase VanS
MTKLFEPFFRMDQARSRGSGHSGLGLTIVKRTLDRLEIPFSLENTDIGILFWMRLPKK